ncbi:MAG: aspartate 1-decarboxylase [Bacteroidia bacterium]|jgi:aspartate 1-decarboxylase|nr:aspartate 1-decarboxylase [Bacteroidia bacterium]
MVIEVLKSKIHNIKVTQTELHYVGSITIDEDILDEANMIAGEKVLIVNNNNGERLETYIIVGKRGEGMCCLNGAAARKAQLGDTLIVMSFAQLEFEKAKTFEPWAAFPDAQNKITH